MKCSVNSGTLLFRENQFERSGSGTLGTLLFTLGWDGGTLIGWGVQFFIACVFFSLAHVCGFRNYDIHLVSRVAYSRILRIYAFKIVIKTYLPPADRHTGWPKKVSHYRESSLNRIKNRQPG